MENQIRRLRKQRGWTQLQLAQKIGAHFTTVNKLETYKTPLNEHWLEELAKAFEVRPVDIIAESPPDEVIWVRGLAQAGAFSEATEWPSEDHYPVSAPLDQHWAPFRKFGIETRGPSMNLVYPEGTICICVSVFEAELEPEVGKRYLVQRVGNSGEYEMTIKELQLDEQGRPWLVPRSSDPAFQAPIPVEGEEGETVQIIARVIASFRKE